MPRYKVGKNTYYTKEKKIRVSKLLIEEGKSSYQIAKEENISSPSLVRKWANLYLENPELLENKKKTRNPLSKYQNKKNLSKEEQLEYEIMKLRIENERLKKGYLVKGDGSIVVFKK